MIELKLSRYSAAEVKELRCALEKASHYLYENFCKTNSQPCKQCKVNHVCADIQSVLNYLKKKEKEFTNET